jgi:2-polyprenyl-3-methyl-5-hydroxy-6-metoxy-1,4-benzoquinol methylase
MEQRFDKAYYDRFYRNPSTRAVTPAAARRHASFVYAYLAHLQIPVRRLIDVGCGVGTMLRALSRLYPSARCDGVEVSTYLCRRYGWRPGSVVDFDAPAPYDLVVCHDVLAYLDDRNCARAIDNLARVCRGAACIGVITADDADRFDPKRTDLEQRLRPAAWYRRRLDRHFISVGGGIYLKRPVDVTVWALEQQP